jgi:hypothetical protein
MPNQYTWTGLSARERLLLRSVRDGECLLWTGRLNGDGYGKIDFEGREYGVHVLAYLTFVGPIPEGLQVQHSCNVRRCFEPVHLSVGTNQRNMDYRNACGRQARGEHAGRAKLTEAQVRELRTRADEIGTGHSGRRPAGEPRRPSLRLLAEEYGITHGTLMAIVHRRTWKHV